jgi:hypothetical protein
MCVFICASQYVAQAHIYMHWFQTASTQTTMLWNMHVLYIHHHRCYIYILYCVVFSLCHIICMVVWHTARMQCGSVLRARRWLLPELSASLRLLSSKRKLWAHVDIVWGGLLVGHVHKIIRHMLLTQHVRNKNVASSELSEEELPSSFGNFAAFLGATSQVR